MFLIALQGFLALFLFFGVNWLGRHAKAFGYQSLSLYDRVEEARAFNFLYRLLAPQVYLIICACAFALVGNASANIVLWRVTAFYFVIRWTFNIVMGRAMLVAWRTQVPLALLTVGLSFWLAQHVLQDPNVLLPERQDISSELWLIVILFVYHTVNKTRFPATQQERRQRSFLTRRYARLKGRYHGVIRKLTTDPWVEALIYSILIYEDFNRPGIARVIENRLLFPLGIAKTLGPMQVTTSIRISDEESVRAGAKRVVDFYPEAVQEHLETYSDSEAGSATVLNEFQRDSIARRVAAKYNPDGAYADEVQTLHNIVRSTFYPELTGT